MSDQISLQELVSSFVDNELLGDQRAAVEKLLAENPQLQRRVDEWREQADRLRALPRYRLPNDFSDRVLQAIAVPSTSVNYRPVETGFVSPNLSDRTMAAASPFAPWRMGLAAIVTLAAMLLLTLFAFPKAHQWHAVATSAVSKSPAAANEVGASMGMVVEEKNASEGLNSGREFELQPEQVNAGKALADSDKPNALTEAADFMSRSGEEDLSKKAASGASKSAMGALSGTPTVKPVAPSAKLKDAGDRESETKIAKSEPTIKPQPSVTNSIGQAAVNQIFVLELPNETQPLEMVAAVLADNSITILNNQPQNSFAVVPGNQAPSHPASSTTQTPAFGLTNHSQGGMEALYVISTASQMQQAITELSNQASISQWQLPQTIFEKQTMLADGQTDAAMENGSTREMNSFKALDSKFDLAKQFKNSEQFQRFENAGRFASDLEDNKSMEQMIAEQLVAQNGPVAQGPQAGQGGRAVALAQQLQANEFGNRQFGNRNQFSSRNQNRTAANALRANLDSANSDSVDAITNSPERPAWFNGIDSQAEPSDDEALVQYLLLVRTADPELPAAPPTANEK